MYFYIFDRSSGRRPRRAPLDRRRDSFLIVFAFDRDDPIHNFDRSRKLTVLEDSATVSAATRSAARVAQRIYVTYYKMKAEVYERAIAFLLISPIVTSLEIIVTRRLHAIFLHAHRSGLFAFQEHVTNNCSNVSSGTRYGSRNCDGLVSFLSPRETGESL